MENNNKKTNLNELRSFMGKAYLKKKKNQEAFLRMLILSGFLEDIPNMYELIGTREELTGVRENNFFTGVQKKSREERLRILQPLNPLKNIEKEKIANAFIENKLSAENIFEYLSRMLGEKNLKKMMLTFCQFRLYGRVGERYSKESKEFKTSLVEKNDIMEPFIIDTDIKNPNTEDRKISKEEGKNIKNIAIFGATIPAIQKRFELFLRDENLNQTDGDEKKVIFLCSNLRPFNQTELNYEDVLENTQKACKYFHYKGVYPNTMDELTESHAALYVAYTNREEIIKKGFNPITDVKVLDSERILGDDFDKKKTRANTQDTIAALFKERVNPSKTLFISNSFYAGQQEKAIKEVLTNMGKNPNSFYLKSIETTPSSKFSELIPALSGSLHANYANNEIDSKYLKNNLSFNKDFSNLLLNIQEENKIIEEKISRENNNDEKKKALIKKIIEEGRKNSQRNIVQKTLNRKNENDFDNKNSHTGGVVY